LSKLEKLLTLAQDAQDRGDDNGVIEHLKDALELAKNREDRASIYEKIGINFYLRGETEEAKKNLFLSLENLSHVPEDENKEYTWLVNDYLGSVFFDEEDYEKALYYKLKAYESIAHIQPKDAFLLVTAIGLNYEKLRNYDKAVEFYLKGLEIQGLLAEDEALLFRFLGQCYDKKGEDRKAFKYYHKLFSTDTDYDAGWYLPYRFGQLSYRFGNYGDSIEYLQKAIAQIPPDQNAYLQSSHQLLGFNYLAKNEFKRALNELEEAEKIKPGSSDVRAYVFCGIAQAYFGLNRITKAIRFGLKALEEQFDQVIAERVYYILAYSYFLKKNEERGKYYCERLREVRPDSGYLRELHQDWGVSS